MERDQTAVVPSVHVRARPQQVVHHVLAAKTCRWAEVRGHRRSSTSHVTRAYVIIVKE